MFSQYYHCIQTLLKGMWLSINLSSQPALFLVIQERIFEYGWAVNMSFFVKVWIEQIFYVCVKPAFLILLSWTWMVKDKFYKKLIYFNSKLHDSPQNFWRRNTRAMTKPSRGFIMYCARNPTPTCNKKNSLPFNNRSFCFQKCPTT